MSNTARPKTAGDTLAADEVNRDLPITINAGETISVASNPQAVYVKATDGEVYLTDSDDANTMALFIGFCLTTGSDGNACTVQIKGIVAGFSGLTIGSGYYLSSTAGAITVALSGSAPTEIGIAISATQILITPSKVRINNGTTTRDMATASGTQNIAHGLGVIPKKVHLTGIQTANNFSFISHGSYNGTTNSCVWGMMSTGAAQNGNSDSYGIYFRDSGGTQSGVITFDATNITITWTRESIPTAELHILWEAET